jgi:hypothetical protein
MTSSEILTEPAPRAEVAARPRRRAPTLLVGLGGALVALGYGLAVEKMRLGPPLVMVALGGMTLAFVARAMMRVLDPLTRAGAGGRMAAEQLPGRARELEREKQLVLKAIKEVELDFQMRKVGESDYRDMVERYRARALRLMRELEAGDDFRALIERELKMRLDLPAVETAKPAVEAPAAQPRRACPDCATSNDGDAQFCKKCGKQLF